MSVWSKKMSESAAFYGMLLGFLGCVIPKTYSALSGVTLPIYLDPFFIGIVMSIVGIVIGNKVKRASESDITEYEKLHVRPESEKDAEKDKKTFNLMYIYLAFGILLGLFFVIFYALPYIKAIG